jgi:hypothetical protein
MATYTKVKLGNSTNGRGILVAATTSPGTLVHTTTTTATTIDEVWLYAQNTDASPQKLTIEWGGTGSGDTLESTIPAESGLYLVAAGLILLYSGSTTTINAFAATTNVIGIFGFVNRIAV